MGIWHRGNGNSHKQGRRHQPSETVAASTGGIEAVAFLKRNAPPRRGLELMKRRRGVDDLRQLCSGPGKLTQALDITDRHHEMDLCVDLRHCFVSDAQATFDIVADKRIGISRSAHLPWRFTLRASPFVSRAVQL